MKHLTFLFVILLSAFTACTKNQNATSEIKSNTDSLVLTKIWETDTLSLITPESVIYDESNNILFVSCIGEVPPTAEDGDGYIAKIGTDGKILSKNWVSGLDAPKGMGIFNGTMYVTDINKLVVINMETATIENKITIKDAEFLNDVDVDASGVVYFTDSNTNTLYKLNGDDVEIVIKDEALGGSNGILIEGDHILTAGLKEGTFTSINLTDNSITKLASGIGGGDGVVKYHSNYIVSDWYGQVFQINENTNTPILLVDTKEAKLNAADIEIIESENLLLVPTFFGNTVTAYSIK